MSKKISIIVPFYHGNLYIPRLLKSIETVVDLSKDLCCFEVLIVNDSPDESVILPPSTLDIKVTQNAQNVGIQKTRVHGLHQASGEWILFLDQDDELISDGFLRQIQLTDYADVIVGNGIYRLGAYDQRIFRTPKAMRFLIRERQFLTIRNLIPSPGECLIRKDCIPKTWTTSFLHTSGSDDWFLWITLFRSNARFTCNPEFVYLHNDTGGNNLSANLTQMKNSSLEMVEILSRNHTLMPKQIAKLKRAILFKYHQDTHQLSPKILLNCFDALCANICYRLILNTLNKIA